MSGKRYAALLILLAACSGGATATTPATTAPTPAATTPVTAVATNSETTVETTTGTTEATGFPVTVAAANGDVVVEALPAAIVSLAPALTEMLFAVGAGEQVTAVDDQSDFPENVPTTDLSGFTPNIEAIASYQPDLVVVSNDIDGLVAALGALDIPVLLLEAAASLDDVFAQIELLGTATGHPEEANSLVEEMEGSIADIVSSVDTSSDPLTYYHELGPELFTVTSSTFIGEVYATLGLENIADPADADGFGYPQLSPEFIIQADPDLIFLADTECCAQTAATVAERPGWSAMSAVTGGGVVELSDDIASRWGPRVVDFLAAAAEGIKSLESTG